MSIRNLSYRLVFPLLAIVSIVAFWRINKVNFFHHYIRVIADVEERNSHELDKKQNLAVFSLSTVQDSHPAMSLSLLQESFLADASHISLPKPQSQRLSGRDSSTPHPIRGP